MSSGYITTVNADSFIQHIQDEKLIGAFPSINSVSPSIGANTAPSPSQSVPDASISEPSGLIIQTYHNSEPQQQTPRLAADNSIMASSLPATPLMPLAPAPDPYSYFYSYSYSMSPNLFGLDPSLYSLSPSDNQRLLPTQNNGLQDPLSVIPDTSIGIDKSPSQYAYPYPLDPSLYSLSPSDNQRLLPTQNNGLQDPLSVIPDTSIGIDKSPSQYAYPYPLDPSLYSLSPSDNQRLLPTQNNGLQDPLSVIPDTSIGLDKYSYGPIDGKLNVANPPSFQIINSTTNASAHPYTINAPTHVTPEQFAGSDNIAKPFIQDSIPREPLFAPLIPPTNATSQIIDNQQYNNKLAYASNPQVSITNDSDLPLSSSASNNNNATGRIAGFSSNNTTTSKTTQNEPHNIILTKTQPDLAGSSLATIDGKLNNDVTNNDNETKLSLANMSQAPSSYNLTASSSPALLSPMVVTAESDNGTADSMNSASDSCALQLSLNDTISLRTLDAESPSMGSNMPVAPNEDLPKSSASSSSCESESASLGNNRYIVWTEGDEENRRVFFTKSTDGGNSFEKISSLSAYEASSSFNPQIAVLGGGMDLNVVWQEDDPNTRNQDVFFTKSTDGGNSFAKPINLSEDPAGSGNPQISAKGNKIYVVWGGTTPGANDIFFRKSTDGGISFSSTEKLTNSQGLSYLPKISKATEKDVEIVWQNSLTGTDQILSRTSGDAGASFSQLHKLNNNLKNFFWNDDILESR